MKGKTLSFMLLLLLIMTACGPGPEPYQYAFEDDTFIFENMWHGDFLAVTDDYRVLYCDKYDGPSLIYTEPFRKQRQPYDVNNIRTVRNGSETEIYVWGDRVIEVDRGEYEIEAELATAAGDFFDIEDTIFSMYGDVEGSEDYIDVDVKNPHKTAKKRVKFDKKRKKALSKAKKKGAKPKTNYIKKSNTYTRNAGAYTNSSKSRSSKSKSRSRY